MPNLGAVNIVVEVIVSGSKMKPESLISMDCCLLFFVHIYLAYLSLKW
jgi:hypothetical protein